MVLTATWRRVTLTVVSNAYGPVMLAFRASTPVLVLAVLLTVPACNSTGSASNATGAPSGPTSSSSSEAAPAGRFTQCLSISNLSNARDPAELRAHAEALRALDLDDDLRGPADALARSYDDLADSLDDLEDDPAEPDSPTDVDSYLQASDRYNDANDDVGLACRQEQPSGQAPPAAAPLATGPA